MKKTLAELQAERARLCERIGAERAGLVQQLAPFQRAAATSERVSALVQRAVDYARQHPVAIAAALGLLVVLKPRRGLRWVQRGWLVWRGWRAVRQWQPAGLFQQLRRFF